MASDPDLQYGEIEIPRSATECFRLLCDIARVPDWVPGVAAVTIERFDANGRALVANYVGMPGRGSFAYSVMYAYEDEDLTIRWSTTDRSLRDLDGEALVIPDGDSACRVRYGLHSSSTPAAPSWASASLDQEAPQRVLSSFKRWAESQLS